VVNVQVLFGLREPFRRDIPDPFRAVAQDGQRRRIGHPEPLGFAVAAKAEGLGGFDRGDHAAD